MSKHGVTRKKHTKKKAPKQQYSTPTRVIQSIVSLDEAFTNPEQSGLPPEVSAIFSQMKILEAKSTEFINAAKLHDKEKREQALNSFFLKNEDFICSNLKPLINTVEIYFRQKHEIPYAHITQRLQQIQAGKIESNHEEKIELLNRKTKESENLFLLGYEKVNVWQTILTLLEKYDEKQPNLRQKSITNMFVDLTQATSYLVNYSMRCTLSATNYYDCYVYLREKADWLTCYAKEYQIYLQALPCEEVQDKQLAWEKNCKLLQCYQSITSFLYSCGLKKEAGTIHEMAQSFLKESYEHRDRFISSELLIETIDEIYKWHRDKYDHIAQVATTVLDNTWLPFLGTLSFFYEQDWMPHTSIMPMPLTNNAAQYDIEYICQAANECKLAFEKAGEEEQAVLPFIMQFRNALSLFSQYKMIPNELKTVTLTQAHFGLALSLYKTAKSRTLDNIFYHQIIVALFKKLADDLGCDFRNFLSAKSEESKAQQPSASKSLPLQQEKIEAEDDTEFNHFIDNVVDQIGALILDSTEPSLSKVAEEENDTHCSKSGIDGHSSISIKKEDDSFRAEQQTIASAPQIVELIHNHESELKIEEEAHHQSLVSLRKEYEQKLLEETKRMEALFKEKKAQMCQSHQEEKTQLSLSLEHDYQEHIQSLTLLHKNALETEQEQHDKNLAAIKGRKKKQYDKKIQRLEKNHESQAQNLKEMHSREIETVHSQYQNNISAQEKILATKLKKITQQLGTTKNRTVSQIEIAHEKKLKTMHKKHESAIQALTESNRKAIKIHEEECKRRLLKETEILEKKLELALSKSRNEHYKNIQCITIKHENAILELETTQNQALEKEKEQQEVQISLLQDAQSARLSARKEEMSTHQASATDGFMPFANIVLPPEPIYILKDLKTAGIEYYFSGGYVRNRLLGIPLSSHEDIDIIVNCNATDLPPGIQSGFSQEFIENRKLKLGKIDLWCEPWHKLEDKLRQRDLSINTFICKDDGAVYDLLDKKQDLHSPYLIMLGDIEERFEHDPSLMMRFIRFSQQLGKSISHHDWDILLKYAGKIKSLNIGIYLKNIEYLFVNTYAKHNLELILTGQILHQVCPLLNMIDIMVLNQEPMLFGFISQKLHEFSQAQENYNYYHVLAVFALIPILQITSEIPYEEKLRHCLNNFFENYTGLCELAEKNKIQKVVASLMFDATRRSQGKNYQVLGILSQYEQYMQYYSYPHQRQQRPPALRASTSIEITQAALEEKSVFIPMSIHLAQSEQQNRKPKKKDYPLSGCSTDRKKGNHL